MERQIEVSGADQSGPPQEAPHRPDLQWTPLVAGAAGLLIGAAAMFVVTANDSPTQTTIPTSEALPAPSVVVTTPETLPPPPTLAELVPGLDTNLLGFGFTPSGSSVVQRWAGDAIEPQTIDAPFGVAISDLSGRWIAALTQQRYGTTNNLQVGNIAYQEAVATDVRSAIWSSDQPGRLVWTEHTPTGTYALDASFGPGGGANSFAIPLPDSALAVWFEGERLTVAVESSLVTFQSDGSEVARLDAAGLVTATDGWAVAMLDDRLMLIDGDLEPRAAIPVDHATCRQARFAPPSQAEVRRLAVLCQPDDGLPSIEVIDIEPGALTFTSVTLLPLIEPATPAWLGSDRFLGVIQSDQQSRPRSVVAILDLQSGELTRLDWRAALFAVIGAR